MNFDTDDSKTYDVEFANPNDIKDRFHIEVKGSRFEQVKTIYTNQGYVIVYVKEKGGN